jgi:hypothetical protein
MKYLEIILFVTIAIDDAGQIGLSSTCAPL